MRGPVDRRDNRDRRLVVASKHAFLNADKGSLNAGLVELGGMTTDFTL